jgi:hypothetical protein
MQIYDYLHAAGNSGIDLYKPLQLAPLTPTWPAPSASRLMFQPFFVGDEDLPLAQLQVLVRCTGFVSGGRWRLGIYNTSPAADQDIYPKALIKDFGSTVSPTSGGLQYITTTAVSGVTLTNGLYYYASIFEGFSAATYLPLCNLSPPNLSDNGGPWLINDAGNISGPYPLGWSVAGVYANALPANAAAGMALARANTSPEGYCPMVFPVF